MRKWRRLLVVALVAVLLLWWLSPATGPDVEPGSILVLNLEGAYVEAPEAPLLARLFGTEQRPFAALLSDLRKAERDERLAAVVLRVRPLEIGWAKAQELRSAIAAIGAAGRKTVAYLEVASFAANLEYYVASAADEVVLSPAGQAQVIGLAAEYLFLGGLWESLGVELEVERIGRYKTFADTFAAKEMSEPYREMANSLLDSIDAQFVAGIAESRGLSEDAVRAAIAAAPGSPEEMLAHHLIDGSHFEDEVIGSLGDAPVVEGDVYAAVDPASVGFEPVAQFALVYGSGAVVTGRGAASRTGQPVLASETVSKALVDAAEDPEIRAILFRVDSPGGSALASDVVWRATQVARKHGKPLVVSFSDVAASGGYYVAAGADAIVASPGTLTGSIGVVVLRPVLAGLFEKLDIGFEALTRGDHADLLLSTRPLSEGTRHRLAESVATIYEMFVARVAKGRHLDAARVDSVGRGRVWTGAQAAELGLVDELGGLRAAAQRAKLAAGLDPDADVSLVPYPRPKGLSEQLSEAMRRVAVAPSALSLPLPRLVRQAAEWLAAVPLEGPALLPPCVFEIR
jgi:protease-4